jgi:hypothetical protein
MVEHFATVSAQEKKLRPVVQTQTTRPAALHPCHKGDRLAQEASFARVETYGHLGFLVLDRGHAHLVIAIVLEVNERSCAHVISALTMFVVAGFRRVAPKNLSKTRILEVSG